MSEIKNGGDISFSYYIEVLYLLALLLSLKSELKLINWFASLFYRNEGRSRRS